MVFFQRHLVVFLLFLFLSLFLLLFLSFFLHCFEPSENGQLDRCTMVISPWLIVLRRDHTVDGPHHRKHTYYHINDQELQSSTVLLYS